METCGLSPKQIVHLVVLIFFFGFVVWAVTYFSVRALYEGKPLELDHTGLYHYPKIFFPNGVCTVSVLDQSRGSVVLTNVETGKELWCYFRYGIPHELLQGRSVFYWKEDYPYRSSWSVE